MSEFVSGISPAGRRPPERRDLVARWGSATTGRRRTMQLGAPAAAAAATSTGRSRWPSGSSSSLGADILADRTHVLVGRRRRAQPASAPSRMHVLAHHHRVEPVRHRVAGVDHLVVAGCEPQRCGGGGAGGVPGAPRCRPWPRRRRPARNDSPRPARPSPGRPRPRARGAPAAPAADIQPPHTSRATR